MLPNVFSTVSLIRSIEYTKVGDAPILSASILAASPLSLASINRLMLFAIGLFSPTCCENKNGKA